MRPSSSIYCSAQKASLFRSKPYFSAMTHAGESGHFKPPQTPSCDLPSDSAIVFGREYTAHLNPCHFEGIAPDCNQALVRRPCARPRSSSGWTHNNRPWPVSRPTETATAWVESTVSASACQNQASPLQPKRPWVRACLGAQSAADKAHVAHINQPAHNLGPETSV
jgi:hypothetical protein